MMGYLRLVLTAWLVTMVTARNEDSCNGRVIKGCTLNLTASSLTVLPTYMNRNTCTIVACHNKLSVLNNTTFNATGDLKEIILRYNEIRKLETGTFKSLHKLQHIDLGYNHIEYVDERLFSNNNLYKLNLEHNYISTINPNMMMYAIDIWKIVIRGNKIIKLEAHTFSNTSAIVEIDISRNEIIDLDPKIFQQNRRISKLDMSSNRISRLHPNIFKSAHFMMCLNISHNRIVSLEAYLFSSNIHLQNLDLSNNAIKHVDTNIFKNNSRLEILNMSNNNLSSINDAIFSHNPTIISVDISHNNIRYIHPETFRTNKKLSILKMRENRLFYLDDQIFFHNNKLKVIHFSNNEITAIPSKIFTTNTEIQSINLSTNRITQISPGTFDTNKNIIDVDLSHNKIKVLDSNIFSETQIKTLNLRGNTLTMKGGVPLLRAPVLENLDLGSCGITTLSPETFHDMLHLKELKMDKNCLSLPIEPDTENNIFSKLHELSKLDLSSNKITVMNSTLFHGMNNLKLLNLSFNPVLCDDCKMEDKCIQFRAWCSSRSDHCGETCSAEVSASQGNSANNTFVSEDLSHSNLNTSSLNISSRRQDIKVHKKKEVDSDKIISRDQDSSLVLYLSLGVCLTSIAIVVGLAITFIRRKRRRRNGGYL
ncbi:hypothetical protein B7P43_G11962 [Cryptotermes secundus]|uniref:LRRCT domain-containing protein n=1 Tax=Cryptotermes secundus TaxID=105785 RepID=A0A2J7R9X2_9NEOP|nr:insulin-like growth factor-binding protein complex acid labile subunit [Cryptotermes secundus]PNF37632.1 hypothetical protein B7P43_G11962 [Cryptotermes secundus]